MSSSSNTTTNDDDIECNICGDDKIVGRPYVVVDLLDGTQVACGQLEIAAASGILPPMACASLPQLVQEPCGCIAPGETVSTAAPAADSTPTTINFPPTVPFKGIQEGPEAYAVDPCVVFDTSTPRFTTDHHGVEFVRTPDEAFAGLADAGYPFEPNYVTLEDGLRMHYVDEGPKSGATEIVLLLHGQPTWSFLYRKMIPVLVNRGGMRVIAPDNIGFGRSDKPTRLTEYTYLKNVASMKAFIRKVIFPQVSEASSPTITLFCQDWGSLFGLRVAGDEPQWFKRIIVANGNLPVFPERFNPMTVPTPVNYNCSDTRDFFGLSRDRFLNQPCNNGFDRSCFSLWIEYALTSPYLTPSQVLRLATTRAGSRNVSEIELAQYDAPYPSRIYSAGYRAFPSMLAGVYEPEFGNAVAWESLQNFDRPFLSLAGELDRNLGSETLQAIFIDNVIGAKVHSFEHKRYANAGHFIQEDVGAEMAAYVADFIEGTPVDTTTATTPISDPPSQVPSVADRCACDTSLVVAFTLMGLMAKKLFL